MAIYKEVDELLNAMDTWDKYGDSFGLFRLNKSNEKDYVPYVRYEDMVQAVTGTPHADVAPVVHAHWIITDIKEYEQAYGGTLFVPEYQCSCCGYWYESYIRADEPKMPKDADFPNYCENCGAKMDEEVE